MNSKEQIKDKESFQNLWNLIKIKGGENFSKNIRRAIHCMDTT